MMQHVVLSSFLLLSGMPAKVAGALLTVKPGAVPSAPC